MTEWEPGHIVEWFTVAATALPPGWHNLFEVDGGHIMLPCPAILINEHRSGEPPYVTAAVFAGWDPSGELHAVWDREDYFETLGPNQNHFCDLDDCDLRVAPLDLDELDAGRTGGSSGTG